MIQYAPGHWFNKSQVKTIHLNLMLPERELVIVMMDGEQLSASGLWCGAVMSWLGLQEKS